MAQTEVMDGSVDGPPDVPIDSAQEAAETPPPTHEILEISTESIEFHLPVEPVVINGYSYEFSVNQESLSQAYNLSRRSITDTTQAPSTRAADKYKVRIILRYEDPIDLVDRIASPKKHAEDKIYHPHSSTYGGGDTAIVVKLPQALGKPAAEASDDASSSEVEEPEPMGEDSALKKSYEDAANGILMTGLIEYIRFESQGPRHVNRVKRSALLGSFAGAGLGSAWGARTADELKGIGDVLSITAKGAVGMALGGVAVGFSTLVAFIGVGESRPFRKRQLKRAREQARQKLDEYEELQKIFNKNPPISLVPAEKDEVEAADSEGAPEATAATE